MCIRDSFKIAFPMALPALITGISLMCMEVMNELGTFALLNIPSISTGIAENWIIEGNPKNDWIIFSSLVNNFHFNYF